MTTILVDLGDIAKVRLVLNESGEVVSAESGPPDSKDWYPCDHFTLPDSAANIAKSADWGDLITALHNLRNETP